MGFGASFGYAHGDPSWFRSEDHHVPMPSPLDHGIRSDDRSDAELGGTADGRRMQFKRALDRLGPDLGLAAEDDDG